MRYITYTNHNNGDNMSTEANQTTIKLLKEELDNLVTIRNDYYHALIQSHDSENIDENTSIVLATLGSLIAKTEDYLKYAVRRPFYSHTWYTYVDKKKEAIDRRYRNRSDNTVDALLKLIDFCGWGRSWSIPQGYDLDFIKANKDISLAAWIVYLDEETGRTRKNKDMSNWLDSFLVEPKFKTGDIVSIRANIPEGSIKYIHHWGNGSSDLRISYDHKGFKDKALMVLGEENVKHTYYQTTYKPNANGGMRRYKVLPVGETTVYWIIERSLKLKRSKAIKDAKK